MPANATPGPRMFGRYRVDAELGRGGMGVVYKAFDPQLQRHVALKVLLDPQNAGTTEVARFVREAAAIAKLRHPNVVPIHDVGKVGAQPYFAMEYVQGTSLDGAIEKHIAVVRKDATTLGNHACTLAKIATGGPWNLLDSLLVVRDVALGLGAAHEVGIVHRDIKPANILLNRDGRPVLTDFGLAKDAETSDRTALTMGGTILGTPMYMSPEQAQGRHADMSPASDVWSLGVTMYQLLTGERPFLADTLGQLLHDIQKKDPGVPSKRLAGAGRERLPREVDAVCMRCLEKDRKQRYPDGNALAEAIDLVIAGESLSRIEPRRLKRGAHPRKARNNSPAPLIGACVAGLLAIVIGVVWMGKGSKTVPPKKTETAKVEEPTPPPRPEPPPPTPPKPEPTPEPEPPPPLEPPKVVHKPEAEALYQKSRSRPAESRATWEESLSLLDQALALEPEYGDAWYERGILLHRLARYPEAVQSFSKAIDHDGPTPWSHYMRARVVSDNMDDWLGAKPDYEEVVRRAPRSELALLANARLAVSRRDLDGAIRLCEEALERTKSQDDAYLILGFLYLQKGYQDLDKALACMTKAIELNATLTKSWVNRAVVYFRRKEYDLARADCDRSIELDPTQGWAFEWKALAYEAEGRYEEAIAQNTIAIERFGERPVTTLGNRARVYGMWGLALRSEGKKEEGRAKMDAAIADLERYLGYAPPGPRRQEAEGELAKARAWLQEW